MRAAVLVLLAASCGTAATPEPAPPAPDTVEEPVLTAIAKPPAAQPPVVEGYLGRAVCSGTELPKDPPHRATCCYPAMELIKRPLRAAYPGLRACYEARSNKAARGRVAFAFRIEHDGTVKRVCATETSTMDDEPAASCMVEVIRNVRWPGMSKAERDLCGLLSLTYPVTFEP